MKVKKVNRYWCDFCRKGGCSAGHMKRHEEGCTLNPNRRCRMCEALSVVCEGNGVPLSELSALLPDAASLPLNDEEALGRVNAALPALREAACNCPNCILAALRQAGFGAMLASDFNWKKEQQAAWDKVNEEMLSHDRY